MRNSCVDGSNADCGRICTTAESEQLTRFWKEESKTNQMVRTGDRNVIEENNWIGSNEKNLVMEFSGDDCELRMAFDVKRALEL
jgi:hypothetical protein